MSGAEPEKYSESTRDRMMGQKTSIRTSLETPQGGTIVTMGFPGLAFRPDGEVYIDPARMRATLSHKALAKCTVLIVLVELSELPEGAFEMLAETCAEFGIVPHSFPIRDYQVPDAAFEAEWIKVAPSIDKLLQDGGTLGLSCHYGAGRSGMMAAGLLIERGASLGEAILTVREQFPDSIESEAQLAWLRKKANLGGQ